MNNFLSDSFIYKFTVGVAAVAVAYSAVKSGIDIINGKKTNTTNNNTSIPDIKNLYFLSLENDKMFLYLSSPKPEAEILDECTNRFDYVKQHKAVKIVFTINNTDGNQLEEYIKLFTEQFGTDSVSGNHTVPRTPPLMRPQTALSTGNPVNL
jgi:hypothetical protein